MTNPWEQFVELVTQNPAVEFMDKHFGQWLLALIILAMGYPAIRILNRYIVRIFEKLDLDETIEMFIQRVISVFLWLVLITLVLDNLGVDITGFVAAFGIVGLAIAFAAQDTISNVFAGIFIMLDRPFKIGDRIMLHTKIGSLYSSWGDVVEIGLRTTKVRSTDGVILTIPNNIITNNPLVNFSHMKSPALRVRIRLGLVISWQNVMKAERVVTKILDDHPKVVRKPKPPQVVFREIRDSDVVLEARFFVANPKDMRFTKSDIIKSILQEFENQKVHLAYPVHVGLENNVNLGSLGFENL